MAFDTKLNLINNKFEQLSGDTLNLSGTTNINGSIEITSNGEFILADGTQNTGYVLTSDSEGKGTWSSISIASGENITKEINQTSHGFILGDYIGWSGGTYNKAVADGNYDGEFVGLITEVVDSNNFKVTYAGYISGLTGLSASTTYWLSPTVDGEITTTEPNTNGQIAKPILFADSTTSAWILSYPGYIITSGTSATFEVISVACSDEDTALSAESGITTFRMPHDMELLEVRASLTTAPSGSSVVVDVNKNSTSILSTEISIDVGEKTSVTAATPPVISDNSLGDDDEITVDLDQVGSSTAGSGLKIYLIGERI